MDGDAVTWTRNTPWRQGHVLPQDAINKLGIVHSEGVKATCVVVASHDCDLANDNLDIEPDVEVIVGCLPGRANGNFTWAKNPRIVHLDAAREGAEVVVELVATTKQLIPKAELAAFVPDPAWSFSGSSLSILRSWLAVRYNRAAFPDAFVDRLDQSKVKEKLAKLIEPMHYLLSTVFFDVDGGKEIDHSDGGAYALKVILVYPPGDDPEETADKVEGLAGEVEALFASRHFDKDTTTWSGVELKVCMAISEDDLTVSQARKLTEWRYEHMTLKEESNNQKSIENDGVIEIEDE